MSNGAKVAERAPWTGDETGVVVCRSCKRRADGERGWVSGAMLNLPKPYTSCILRCFQGLSICTSH